jgi:hypothetical protein
MRVEKVNARPVLHCFRNSTLLNGDGNRGRQAGRLGRRDRSCRQSGAAASMLARSLGPVMQPEPIVTRSWINSSLVMLARQAGEKRQCG